MLGKEGDSTIIENGDAEGVGVGVDESCGCGDRIVGGAAVAAVEVVAAGVVTGVDIFAAGGAAEAVGVVASNLGDERPACEMGVTEGDRRSLNCCTGCVLGKVMVGIELKPGRPAAVRSALNLDTFERAVGGGSDEVDAGCNEDEEGPPEVIALVLPLLGGTVWMYCPSGPRLYASPLRKSSSTSCNPPSSSSLALSLSPPTSLPLSSILPVRIAFWIVRVEEAGRTEAPSDVDDDAGNEEEEDASCERSTLYAAASLLARN